MCGQFLLPDSLQQWLGCVSCFSMSIPALRWLCHRIWKPWTFHEYLESTAHLGSKQSAPSWHNIIYTLQNNFKSSSTTLNWRKLQHATILSCWRQSWMLLLSKNSYLHDSAHEFLHFWWFRTQILENDCLVEMMPSIHTIIIGLFKNIC